MIICLGTTHNAIYGKHKDQHHLNKGETQMNKHTWTIGLAIATIAGTAHAQFYRLGAGNGLSNSISDNGIVVGDNDASGQYYMWSASNGLSLIGGAVAGNGIGGQPTISNDGLYVGGTNFSAANGWYEMARYDVNAGAWTGIGALPGIGTQIDASVGSGWGISGNGQNIAGLAWTTQGTADAHAVSYNFNSGWTDHGTNAVGNSSRANALSYDGSVVAGWQDGSGRQGSVWNNGVQQLIFTDTGGIAQEAFAVSDNGQYVTGLGLGSFFAAGNAYRYNVSTDTYEALDNLAVGGESRMAGAAINGDGTLIAGGTWGLGPATFGTAFVWEEGVGTLSMTDYLDSQGVDYEEDFHFSFVSGMSSDGQWMTGWGYNIADGLGSTETWVIQVPAPSGLAFLSLGALTATRRRRS